MTASLNGDVKSIPIRCLIEIKHEDQSCVSNIDVPSETETFAIVPSNTLFKDVVKTVLPKLGYSTHAASTAKGAVQIKKWRALDLEQVSENEHASVEDILGDLANVATLRIKIISRPRSDDVKDKLLLMLLRHPYDVLISKGCPISKDILERVVEGQDNLSANALSDFDLWYKKHLAKSEDDNSLSTVEQNLPVVKTPTAALTTSGKSRPRISFYTGEVFKLQQWFDLDPHPSRQTMTKYMAELNSMPIRMAGAKLLDLTNIMYWFKNARAAARRNGRSVTSDDLSEDEAQCEKESPTITVPPLPNSNAVYVIQDPLVGEACDNKVADHTATSRLADESDMEEDLSVTDNESEINDGDNSDLIENHGNMVTDAAKDDDDPTKPDSQIRTSSTTSSPQMHSNFAQGISPRIPGYPFPYGAFPMAYLQSHMNPFYKDWSEKVQSAVAQAHANNSQQNLALMKPELIKSECELSKAERQKRHRAFIDPVSEIPKLEQWFTKDTHPSHYVIEQICDDLNRGEFRSRYPKLSPKNIQLWFKNHRAKVKRMRVGGTGLNFSDLDSSQINMNSPSHLAMTMM